MKSGLRNLLGLFLIGAAFTGAVCGPDGPAPPPPVGNSVSKIKDNPTDPQAQQDLLKTLATATSAICTTDSDKNGTVDAMDVINLAKSRISNAPIEKPATSSASSDTAAKTNTELFLERISAICPEHKAEANFTKTMFKVGQAVAPISDLLGLTSLLSGGTGDLDINKLIGPLVGIITPETPCADKGLAQCGKDMSDAVDAMGTDISAKTYELTEVTVTVGETTANLSGKYNEATLRTIGAVGSMVHGLFYFLAAHVDINSLLSEVTSLAPLLSGGIETDTAGQILTTIDILDSVIVKVFEGPIDPTSKAVSASGAEKLGSTRDSTAKAIKWINGDGGSKPIIITGIEQSKEESLAVRFFDNNGNGSLDGCDEIQVNLSFIWDVLKDIAPKEADKNCTGGLRLQSFQLPSKSGDKAIDYPKLFAGAASALSKFQSAVNSKSVEITASDLNTILVAVGESEIKDVFKIYPGVIFDSGLSFMTPGKPGAKPGTASALKDYFEMEINADAPACPDGKTKDGALICKNKKGDKDQSKLISRGDADHFDGKVTKDSIYVTEKLLDENAKKADDTFRAVEGGGFLPYLLFKNEDLKGFAKVADTLIGEMTTPVTGKEADGICLRKIAQTSGSSFKAVDAKFMNALVNFVLVQAMTCGTDSQLGGLLGGMDVSSGLSIPGLASAR